MARERSLLERIGGGLQGFSAGAANPLAHLQLQQQQQQRQQEQQQLQQLGNILSGESIPAFARPGGAEPESPEQAMQTKKRQLGALATPASINALSALAPQQPIKLSAGETLFDPNTRQPIFQGQVAPTPQTALGKVQSDIQGGFIPKDLREEAIKTATAPRKLEERRQLIAEKKFGLEAKKFEKAFAAGGMTSDQIFNRTSKIRGEFVGLSKDFIAQRDSYGRIQASGKDPSAAGDLALIFNFMKLLDPRSVVRESEFATARNARGVSEQIRGTWNRLLKGEQLAPGQRKDFLARADKLFQDSQQQHDKRIKTFTSLAETIGLDPAQVTIDIGRETEKEPQSLEPSISEGVQNLNQSTPEDAQNFSQATQLLRQDPSQEAQEEFNKLFGQGASQNILGQ